MSLIRLTIAAAAGLALVLCLTGAVSADDVKSPSDVKPDKATEADEPLPPDQPPRPGFGGAAPFGPRPGRGPGQPAEGHPLRPLKPFQPGMGAGGPGMGLGGPGSRLGPPGQGAPPSQGGPRRFGHPGGPPRWPHENWDALQKNDPEMYELLVEDQDLDRQARQLAIQYRRAPIGQRAAIKKELEQLLGRHFEVRQQRRILELKRLEEELKRLREAIDLRSKAREELVGKRITQLLGEQEGLDF